VLVDFLRIGELKVEKILLARLLFIVIAGCLSCDDAFSP
jgi:hypothetical protein